MTCVKTESSRNRFSRKNTDCDATKRAKTARGIRRGFLVIRTEKLVLSPVKRLLSKKESDEPFSLLSYLKDKVKKAERKRQNSGWTGDAGVSELKGMKAQGGATS